MIVRRPNRKPPYGSIRGIDWGHPLTRGLVFAVVADDGSGKPKDLVSGIIPTIGAGAPKAAITSRGIATQGSITTVLNYGRTKADEVLNGSIFLVAQQDADGVTTCPIASGENANGFGYQLFMDDVSNVTNGFYLNGDNSNQGNSGFDSLGTASHGKMHTFMATFSSTNQLWYANGALKNTTGSGFTATAHANRVTKMFCRRSDDANFNGKVLCCYVFNRILTLADYLKLESDVFQFLRLAPSIAVKAPVAGGSTGTLARTNANDTSAATGASTVTGTLARTNANDTLAASGASTVTGSLAKTNANDTVVASGSTGSPSTGTLATTNANDTLAASGASTVSGSLARTNANDTLAASGASTVTGSVAKTNANDTLAASGTSTVTGAAATTNANDTLAASGISGAGSAGSLATTNANDTSAAAGTSTVVGTSSTTNANDTLAASGASTVTGSLAKTNANDTVSAAGISGAPTGTVNATNANDTASAAGAAGIIQGGGGGKKRQPSKSWDQRERERLEQIRLDNEARQARIDAANKAKYGDLPPELSEALGRTEQPYKHLSPQAVKAYANSQRNDDEEAMALILALL